MAYAQILTALSDPTRRNIFESLAKQPKTVTELALCQPVSRPAVSQHLKILQNANLVSVKPQGNHRLYLIRKDGLDDLRAYLDGFWSETLTAYSDEIAKRVQSKMDTIND